MDSRIARGLDDKEQEQWEKWLKASRPFLDTIGEILEAEASAIDRDDSQQAFEHPNALVVLAHRAGRRAGIRHALSLLKTRGA